MKTRREFLVSTAAVSALPTLISARPIGRRVCAVGDLDCVDGSDFSRYFGAAARDPSVDPTAFLLELEQQLAVGELDVIVGLTRGSTRFLIEQIAMRLGYMTTYSGEHSYLGHHLFHRLNGHGGAVAQVSRQLRGAQVEWARELASSMEELAELGSASAHSEVTVDVSRPAGSAGYLCSWLLRRV